MELFLRVETNSNILGSKDTNVTYIAASQITSVRSNSNGGSLVSYGLNSELSIPEITPDNLMANCMHSLIASNIEPEIK